MVLGDFNEILSSTEHSRFLDYTGNGSWMVDFQSFVSNCDLEDLVSYGPKYTWWNSQEANPIRKKLDS